jgi:hypothetical protein
MWEHPVDPGTIQSLLLLHSLDAAVPDRSALRARGIAAAFRAQRIKIRSGANFKINFSTARGV